MRTMQGSMLAALACASLAGAAARAADDPARPVAFRADARVELDAGGRPTRIEVSRDLPEAIRAYVARRVAAYTYSPPHRDGVSGPAVTYLHLGACAIPEGAGYRLGLDYKGNGPRLATPGARVPVLPFPPSAMRSGRTEVTMQVAFHIEPDGSATFDKVTYADGDAHRRDGFDALARAWPKLLRFEPEQLAGRALRSQATIQLTYTVRRPGAVREGLVEQALRSRECQAAAGADEGPLPVALDSPVRVVPTSS